jgi:hypothetical protein
MIEMYQFARTMAASVTPDPRYLREVETELLGALRARQQELVNQGYDEVLAGLVVMKEFRDETHLSHVYPARDSLGIRLRAMRDALAADPAGWMLRVTSVAAVILATLTVLVLAGTALAAVLPAFLDKLING